MSIPVVLRFFAEEAEHRSYPVVDEEGGLLGLVSRTDALRWQVEKKEEGTLAELLSDASTKFAYPDTSCGEVADMMVESGVGRVPIRSGYLPGRPDHLAAGPAEGALDSAPRRKASPGDGAESPRALAASRLC